MQNTVNSAKLFLVFLFEKTQVKVLKMIRTYGILDNFRPVLFSLLYTVTPNLFARLPSVYVECHKNPSRVKCITASAEDI